MLSLSNTLTLLRLPAALLFTIDSVYVRLSAIALAMVSDALDGYFARKNKTVSQLGAILDPIMDKFFAFFALGILVATVQLPIWAMLAMISRDFFLFLFGLYLTVRGGWDKYEFKAVIWGKITTAAQLTVLVLVVMRIKLPWIAFVGFIPLGVLTALSLYIDYSKKVSTK
ncbi:MAG: CDP-diacylglycerol--glycerol-3-phosphate 3-phosphatidyltransferase [Chlamydiae bacterium]|nr:CDP-diacylglycerol--glycerol-3-phosphate 3-phosphatidyltransferase [Chlamydiota bacterium]